MKKNFLLILCLIMLLTFASCSKAEAVEPDTSNAVITGGAQLTEDEDGNNVIENLTDGDYIQWVIAVGNDSKYSVEIEYASENDEFNCNVELYSENGKLQMEKKLVLPPTGSKTSFDKVAESMGEITAGNYTLIVRPDNLESKSINIKSVKLVP